MKTLYLLLLLPLLYVASADAQSNQNSMPSIGIGASVQAAQSGINLLI